jgi:hypothetical protein
MEHPPYWKKMVSAKEFSDRTRQALIRIRELGATESIADAKAFINDWAKQFPFWGCDGLDSINAWYSLQLSPYGLPEIDMAIDSLSFNKILFGPDECSYGGSTLHHTVNGWIHAINKFLQSHDIGDEECMLALTKTMQPSVLDRESILDLDIGLCKEFQTLYRCTVESN